MNQTQQWMLGKIEELMPGLDPPLFGGMESNIRRGMGSLQQMRFTYEKKNDKAEIRHHTLYVHIFSASHHVHRKRNLNSQMPNFVHAPVQRCMDKSQLGPQAKPSSVGA